MTGSAARRIARVRPLVNADSGPGSAPASEAFFVANDAPDFASPGGRIWTVIDSPFPGSPANSGSAPRPGWQPGALVSEDGFAFLAPSVPANVFGMAHNTGAEGRALPPQAFHKAASSVIGPGEAIELAPEAARVEPEAELTAVIGRKARGLTLANARSAVLGFTIGNDVTDRERQASDALWISAKSQDTFTPAGPWIVTVLDDAGSNGSGLSIGVVHNGTALRTASTADLGWSVDEILVYLSSFLTLHPGDLVLTGFPAEAAIIRPGDTVSCRVEGIGELTNPVAAASRQETHSGM